MALTLVVVGAGTAYAKLEKSVTLVVDGKARGVRTLGSTVEDLLDDEGLLLNRHDEIRPSLEAGLAEGMEVDVSLAKEISLVLNGAERTVWVTGATVRDVLEQVNLRTGRNASIEPSRGASVEHGDVIVYEDAVQVELTADGRTRRVITNAEDVGYLLDSLGVVLRGHDRVEPRPGRPIRDGMAIRVVRVELREVVQDEAVPFGTRVRYTDEMYEGETRVIQEGAEGLIRRVYEVRLENGREVRRRLLRTTSVREPVDRILEQGTRPLPTQYGIASWYQRDGMVAAHQSLPFGTRVAVTNLDNGRTVSVVINDRGPYIEGRIIDLSDDAFAQLAPLSRGTCRVRITW